MYVGMDAGERENVVVSTKEYGKIFFTKYTCLDVYNFPVLKL